MLLIIDIDCKLKSAAQTPATMHNNIHGNVPEILGRPVTASDTQMFYKTVSLSILILMPTEKFMLLTYALGVSVKCDRFCML